MAPPNPEDAVAEAMSAQVAAAAGVPALRSAARCVDEWVLRLHAQSTPVERISQQVGRLNARIFARLWGLLAPPELVRSGLDDLMCSTVPP